MILTYSEKKFMDRTISGEKQLSFREDKHRRWKVGMSIQFWMHNPRNVKKNPFQFGTGKVLRVRFAIIDVDKNEVRISGDTYSSPSTLRMFAILDGFDSWEECKAFHKVTKKGVVINWEEFKQIEKQ
jgi:hypothetical protein